jgi:hypothetical protein
MCVRVPARARVRGMTGAGYMKGYIRVCGACCSIVCLSNIYLSRSVRCNLHFKPNGSCQLPEIDHIRLFARADTRSHTRARARTDTRNRRGTACMRSVCERACVRVGVRARVRKRVCACAACVRPQMHALAYIDTYRHSVSTQAFLTEHICRCIHLRMDRWIDTYIYIYRYNRDCFRLIGIAVPFDSIFSLSFR